jgi:hypothetical protein
MPVDMQTRRDSGISLGPIRLLVVRLLHLFFFIGVAVVWIAWIAILLVSSLVIATAARHRAIRTRNSPKRGHAAKPF